MASVGAFASNPEEMKKLGAAGTRKDRPAETKMDKQKKVRRHSWMFHESSEAWETALSEGTHTSARAAAEADRTLAASTVSSGVSQARPRHRRRRPTL